MNDLATLDGKIHDALDADDPDAGYFFRLLCGTLRELWRLFVEADSNEAVAGVVSDMASEAREAFAEVRELFIRPEAAEGGPESRSWAELHLKDVRDRTFHYPLIGSEELSKALRDSRREQARVRDAGSRPLEFADVVALQAGFGNITQEEELTRFRDIVEKAKDILRLLVPVVWSALGTYLRARDIEPKRLRAPYQAPPEDDPADAG